MTKLWTVSRGPIIATTHDLTKAAAIGRLLSRPVEILPSTEGGVIRPFAIGLWDELRTLLRPDATVTTLRRATSAYPIRSAISPLVRSRTQCASIWMDNLFNLYPKRIAWRHSFDS